MFPSLALLTGQFCYDFDKNRVIYTWRLAAVEAMPRGVLWARGPGMSDGPRTTSPPGRYVILYDGQCRFCDAGSRQLLRMARRGAIDRVDFQQPGALDPFPGLTHDACMKQMYLVAPDGRLYAGFEAAVRAVVTRRVIGGIAYVYYVPGVRQLCDWLYRWIAARRYRLLVKKAAAGECESGACAVHFGRQ